MVVRIVIGMPIFIILSVYAPQTGRPEQEKQDFYDALDKVLDECVAVIVAGDLNGHLMGEKIADGTRILDFALAYNLRITNTWFKKPTSQLITYCSGPAKTQVDYIMCRKKIAVAQNVKAIPVGTQHKMVVADFATDSKLPRPPKPVPRMRTFKLKDPEYRTRFQEKLGDLTDTETWEDLKAKLKATAEETCGFSKEKKKKETWWWSSELEALVKEKRDTWKNWTTTRSVETRKSYVEARNRLKTALRVCEEADDKRIFAIAKQRAKEQEDIVGSNCLRAPDGKLHMRSYGKTPRTFVQGVGEND